jgi:hypothetical protein
MIDEFAKVLGHVMGLKSMNQEQLALEELRKGYKTWFGLDADQLAKLSEDEFLPFITGKEFKPQQLEALAQALKLEGDLLEPSVRPLADEYYRKALSLFLHLEKTDGGTFSLPRKNSMQELKEKLGNW